jgi:hypothetical protein
VRRSEDIPARAFAGNNKTRIIFIARKLREEK